jgi:N-acylneuraminate cytidylyltransferase
MKIAIIPARKGSKRLINKNKKILNGIPLIEYTLKFAKENNFDKIIVSSDDNEILEMAKSYGYILHKRDFKLSGDESLIKDLLKNIIINFSIGKNDIICLLQPTNPIRENDLYKKAIDLYNKGDYDTIMSISKLTKKIGVVSKDVFLPNYIPGARSQDINFNFYENGDIYIIKSSNLINDTLFGNKIGYLITGENIPNIDIDSQYDFDICKMILNNNRHKFKYLK